MPYLKLKTNLSIDKQHSSQLMSHFSQLLADETGKSEQYVMVDLMDGRTMMFGGSQEPLAYLECKSIGLTTAQAKSLSAAICDLLQRDLKIPADRVYIEFNNCPAEYWGWNAVTFG